jgi:hypothetical protein
VNHRRAAAVLLAALLMWPAAPAAAKEIRLSAVRACGPTGCAPLSAPLVSHALTAGLARAGGTDAAVGPYYRLRIRPSRFGPEFLYYLPGTRVLDANGQAFRVGSATAARFRAELGPVQPFAPRIVSVSVGARRVARPARYTAMLYNPSVSPPPAVWNHRHVLIGIELAGETPWSGWGSAEYFPAVGLLHVPDGRWVRITPGQAAMIGSDLHPGAQAHAGSGSPTAAIAGALLAAAAAVAVAAVLARRRPWRRTRVV